MAIIDGELPALNLPTWSGVTGLPGAAGNSNPSATVPVTIGGQEVDAIPASEIAQTNDAYNYLNNTFGLNLTNPYDVSGTSNGGAAGGSSSTSGSLLSDLFLRATVIILGFIFVAVGLSMFNSKTIINQVSSKLPIK